MADAALRRIDMYVLHGDDTRSSTNAEKNIQLERWSDGSFVVRICNSDERHAEAFEFESAQAFYGWVSRVTGSWR